MSDTAADRFFRWLDTLEHEPLAQSMIAEFGVYVEHTGGGCTALAGRISSVNFVYVTDEDARVPNWEDRPIVVAVARTREQLHDGAAWDDGAVESRTFPNADAAREWLRALRAER
jgi:hypothetical protein